MSGVLILRILIPVAAILAAYRIWRGWASWREIAQAGVLVAVVFGSVVIIEGASPGAIVFAAAVGGFVGAILMYPRRRDE